jgi:hypothetical protein
MVKRTRNSGPYGKRPSKTRRVDSSGPASLFQFASARFFRRSCRYGRLAYGTMKGG